MKRRSKALNSRRLFQSLIVIKRIISKNNHIGLSYQNCDKYSWFEGQIYCTQMNMTLVEIKTEAKSLELYSLIKKAQEQKSIKGDYIWIGGILNRFPTHQFVWLSTGEYFTYTNWYDNNPDFQDDNEFCVELVMDENWKWNDDSCITTGGFICECKEGTKKEETQNKF
ncbi:hypothetical protein FF38_10421 [Lucilia cuprina]|uniref:C-type lectin domain-containing protein n=1 Tax=Lucilia cuprina TaxID=7375 RepID=A0A0L0BQK6_LUCCU|nr:hypothetical protein FF38_10421 [Lucilia cuprina]